MERKAERTLKQINGSNALPISVIVPVYNVEDYLLRCLESISSQTFTNWQCVLVDDGSTDQSGIICDEYVKKDSRFTVFHRTNHGLSQSRYYGFLHSDSEYVVFVDSDDWLDDTYLESMYDCVRNCPQVVDIVMCDYWMDNSNSRLYINNAPSSCKSKTIITETLNRRIHAGLWSKMIRRSLLSDNDVSFSRYDYYEDMYMFLSLLQYAEYIVYKPKATYHYYNNPQSLTHDKDVKKRMRRYEEFVQNMDELNRKYLLDSDDETSKALDCCINFEKRLLILNYFDRYNEIKGLLRYFPKSMKYCYCNSIGDFCFLMASRFGFILPYTARAFFKRLSGCKKT